MSSCLGLNSTSKVLGLDISTSCTGVCILDQDGKLILLDNIRLDNCEGFFQKCAKVYAYMTALLTAHNITHVFIEQDMQAFRPGLSSASTINTLARFNGAVTFITYQIFKVQPTLINVTNARSVVGLKIDHRDKTKSTKQKVFEWVQPQIVFDWPMKKTGAVKTSAYDMSDAYVISRAGIELTKSGKLNEDDL